jgi:hypothetical protein
MHRSSLLGALAALLLAGALAGAGAGCDASGSVQGGQSLLPDPCAATDGGHTWSDLYICYFGPQGKASCTAQGSCHGNASQTGASTSGFVCGASKEACWRGMTQGIVVCGGNDGGEDAEGDAGAEGGDAAKDAPADVALDGPRDASTDARADAPSDATMDGTADGGADGAAEAEADGATEAGCPSALDAGAGCMAALIPIVPPCTTDPTTTGLWSALSKVSGGGRGNMPCAQPSQACPPNAPAYTFTAEDLARISAWINEGAQYN